ncbi:hypothetical protein SESBI_25394 [Sesbania bispinosa]|nr:hypothetical protein SESBI_25394 [Sesbania bispinosa]
MKFRICAQIKTEMQAFKSNKNPNLLPSPSLCSIGWLPPQDGWIKLNTDGVVATSSVSVADRRNAECGGLTQGFLGSIPSWC